MPIDFYYTPGSSPCRSVLLAAKALGVDLNLNEVNLMKGEQMTPEFLKMNPQHTIPTINDNGFCLWESRAILTYLADQYGKNDSLYPKDTKKRALVDQKLYFDMGTLYGSLAAYYYPVIFGGGEYSPALLTKIDDAFKFFEIALESNEFAAGDDLTVADLALVTTVSTFEVLNYEISKFKNVSRWYNKVKVSAPGYDELNAKNVLALKAVVEMLAKK